MLYYINDEKIYEKDLRVKDMVLALIMLPMNGKTMRYQKLSIMKNVTGI